MDLPLSRAALWSGRLAMFALALVLLGVALARTGRIELPAAVVVLGAGLAIAIAAALLAVAAFAVIWGDGRPGFGQALGGMLVAGAIVALPAWMGAEAVRLPRLADVSTDLVDPPAFSRSRKALEARGGALPPEPAREARDAQKGAYPGLAPLTLELSAQDAYALALKAAQARGWSVIESAAPGGRSGVGRIDAVDHTLVMRMPLDVTVRIRPLAAGARVDVRSRSRSAAHDLGANAKRISTFLSALQELADNRD
ncbi:hypothetical protein GCM10007036_10030 [Alsobacter metallidurans]|uniref:DUF1499 domain-containing protein n=1 Tax=Alsobacter metallidurans TaxID=340221 RepID=A0A917I563_9HYPH|nr:hypothetical protein GCM10007036_10030 [Alsobacter metallidurans]